MDLISDDSIIEKFKVIKAFLSQKELPVSSSFLSKQLKISTLQSSVLLNDFVLNEESALDKYIILFLIEQIKDNNISFELLASNDNHLTSILASSHTLSFSTFAIINKSTVLSLDYGTLVIPNDIEYRYNLNIAKASKPPTNHKIEQKALERVNEKKINQDFNSKLIVGKQDEENMYGGFNPKKQEVNEGKRKVNDTLTSNQVKKITKKNNSKNNFISSPKKESSIIETNSYLEEQEENKIAEDVKMKDSEEINDKTEQGDNNQPNKVLKKRKVKKTVQKVNEKGYLVTEDQWIEEEYWEEEKTNQLKQNNLQQHVQPTQVNKKQKKLANGQSSLVSFLNK